MKFKTHLKLIALLISLQLCIAIVAHAICFVKGIEFRYVLYWRVPTLSVVAWLISAFIVMPFIEKITENDNS